MKTGARIVIVIAALSFALPALGQKGQRRARRQGRAAAVAPAAAAPASQPASAPASRPAGVDAKIPPEEYKQYLATIKKIQQEKHPEIQELRRKIQEKARAEQIDFNKMQDQSRDKAAIQARRARVAARHRNGQRKLDHVREGEEARREAQTREQKQDQKEAGYVQTLSELGRLESAWRVCGEAQAGLQYKQGRQAESARQKAAELLGRAAWHDYPTSFDDQLVPITRSIQAKLDAIP